MILIIFVVNLMEKTLAEKIAEYVLDLKGKEIPEDIKYLVKERIVDSIGVMIGAYDAAPIKIIRDLLSHFDGRGATGVGIGETSPDHAAFLNGCMTRHLDFNDTYLSKEALHPSDNIPGVYAVGEYMKVDGELFIKGIIAAYEIACRLADASSIRDRGWDHTTYIAISSAVGASLILDMPMEKIMEAINIAAATNINLRQIRVGELSMWKGCAAGNAIRNGVFSALLAYNGMTGPKPVFEGERGFFRQVSGEMKLNFQRDGYKIRETSIKKYPVEYHSMSAVEAALKVRERIKDINRIEKITIDTFTVSYQIIVKDPEKWRPKTKETADHSLPYIVSTVLIDGYIWLDSYDKEKLTRNETIKLLDKTDVRIGEGFDEYYPVGIPNRVTVKTIDGDEYSDIVIYPRGHFKNRMSKDEIYEKYERLTRNRLDNYKEIWDMVWNIDKLRDVSVILESINSGLRI